jgi:hypothetical protein
VIAHDLALDLGVFAPIFGVAAQEFDGEAGAFEAIQVIDRLRRAPILCGHGVSSRLAPLLGELQTIRKRRLCARPYDCIAHDDNPYNRRLGDSLRSWLKQVPIAGFGHPAGAGEVAFMDDFGAAGLLRRIESEEHQHDLSPVGALFLSHQQP